jgi:hypothetical protein
MIGTIVALPIQIVRTVGALPGRLESIERSLSEMQKLLGDAVGVLAVIQEHTEGMHGQLARIDANTSQLDDQTQDLADNTARLVRIASPLERGALRGALFRRRGANGTTTE